MPNAYEMKVTGFRCLRCSHTWVKRNKTLTPLICPKCKSKLWNVPKKAKK